MQNVVREGIAHARTAAGLPVELTRNLLALQKIMSSLTNMMEVQVSTLEEIAKRPDEAGYMARSVLGLPTPEEG